MGVCEEAGTVLVLLLGFDPGNGNQFSAEQSSPPEYSRNFQYLETPEIMLTDFYNGVSLRGHRCHQEHGCETRQSFQSFTFNSEISYIGEDKLS